MSESDLEARVAALEAMSYDFVEEQQSADDQSTYNGGHVIENQEETSVENHSWRFVTQDTEDSLQWGLTDTGDSGTRAGRVFAPGGTATDVDSEWNDYTKGDAVTGWLKVTCAVAEGTFTITTAEIVTDEPSADPFNATAPVFVFHLFDLLADGTFTEYQTSDISLEGLLAFDDTTRPENIVAGTAENGDGKDPARKNHKHKLDISGWTIPAPEDMGTASAGTSALPARADHIHASELPIGGDAYQVMQRNGTNTAWVVDDVRMTT